MFEFESSSGHVGMTWLSIASDIATVTLAIVAVRVIAPAAAIVSRDVMTAH